MSQDSQTSSKLYVAFIWHMHQPEYKDSLTGHYLMPWVRLHSIKDYLDMVCLLEKFPKIKQTFNLVPSLMEQIEDYTKPETMDDAMRVTLLDTYTDADRRYIMDRCFDASPDTMIAKSSHYFSLMEKRNMVMASEDPDFTQFSDQEYADITALFNLVWFDPMWLEQNTELQKLWQKQYNYTMADRKRILAIQRELISKIIPTYREYQEKGQIEITTTPYFHPILPLLIDTESARVAMPEATLPELPFQHPDDAAKQIQMAWDYYESRFGCSPKGVWPSEQSVSPETIELLKKQGFQWAVTSEGILARSAGIHFQRDPYGNVLNAETLSRPYRYAGMNMIFRNLTLSDMIGFQYANFPAEHAAQDLLNRLKQIQRRCTEVGLDHAVVTIALDGENCWESFTDDGHAFLGTLYSLLSEDQTIEVCRVRDYFDQIRPESVGELNHLHSGSWIQDNFHIWIGDPVKNAAWSYLIRTRDDLAYLSQSGKYDPKLLEKAWHEIYIAEGSDWFWWYGEPHSSGQDDLFDMQFRRHLANVYRILGLAIPDYLDVPLVITLGRPVLNPVEPITPTLSGMSSNFEGWEGAGQLDLTHGAMHRGTRLISKVYYGSNESHFYIRLDLDPNILTPHHEVMVYMIIPGKTRHNSPIRRKLAGWKMRATERYLYAYEISFTQMQQKTPPVSIAEALPYHLWQHRPDLSLERVCGETLDMAIPFDHFGVYPGDALHFALAIVQGDIIEEFLPENFVLALHWVVPHVAEPDIKIKQGDLDAILS